MALTPMFRQYLIVKEIAFLRLFDTCEVLFEAQEREPKGSYPFWTGIIGIIYPIIWHNSG